MNLKETYHIFKTNDGEYLVSKIMEYNEIITNKIVAKFDGLKEAQEFLGEDGVPANSIAVGDNIDAFSPFLGSSKKRRKKKQLMRRFAPMLRT